jgi:hypothetical protein
LGCLNVKISCDDGDSCTIDRCHCDEGCQHFPVDTDDFPQCKGHDEEGCSSNDDCEDSSACTVDSCRDGKCHKIAVDCDDGDLCTVDSCHNVDGCLHARIEGAACEGDMKVKGGVIAEGIIVHDMQADMETAEIQTENISAGRSDSVLTAGPIAGIAAGVVALVAVLGLIGYRVTQKKATTVSDNSYSSM